MTPQPKARAAVEAEPPGLHGLVDVPGEELPGPGGGMWDRDATEVLIVDDDVFLRLDLSDRLRQRGFLVIRAADAAQAIKTMEKHPSIEAVFSDLQISGSMDGLALLREITRRWPGRRLVLISGWSSPSQQEMPPGTQFLSKPITRTSLDRALQVFRDSEPSPSG